MNKNLKHYNLVFIGFMGVGKSTIASKISKFLNREIIDIDKKIIEKTNMEISDIFNQFGEEYFRNIESNIISEISTKKDVIISCGGGSVIREKNISLLKENGIIIRLTANPHTIFNRVRKSNSRPILKNNMNEQFISSLMEKRDLIYKNAADITISTDYKSIKEISDECINESIKFLKNKYLK